MRSLWATWTGRGLSTGSFAGKVVATLIGVAYFLYGAWQNLRITLVPMRYDGDHAQAVAHYWRYAVDGAMPPGDLLTDYAFLMHAPVGWWLPMAGLSMVVSPLVAAKLLSVVAYAATGSLAWLIVQRKGNAYLAAAALILVARCSASHFFLAGGYARSFGPALVLLFLAAWLLWGHRVVLVVLVVQAALYPSVVIPCGLTYGAYCVLAGPMRDRLRRCASLTVAGVLIIGLGLMQDLRAPKEWGSVVWLEEALEMPAWGRGGRITEAPLKPISAEVEKNFIRAYTTHGKVPLKVKVSPRTMARWFAMGWGVALLLVVLRKLWRGPEDEPFALPWQLPALYVGAFAGYMLARLLAFKLYLPYRALAHTWVWIVLLAMPLVAYELGMWLFKRHKARATAFAVVLSVVPTIALLGDGLAQVPGIYTNTGADRTKLYAWIRKDTALDAFFAGDLGTMDRIPLFSYRQVLVNRALAHPFRPGFYELCEERVRDTYAALYSDDLADVLRFAKKWDVDYVAFHVGIFDRMDKRLFEPVRGQLAQTFKKNKKKGFALLDVPKGVIIKRDGKVRVLDVKKLERALQRTKAADAPAPPDAPARVDEGGEGEGEGDEANDGADAPDGP